MTSVPSTLTAFRGRWATGQPLRRVSAGDNNVRVSKLALDHDDGDAFVRHVDRVSMPPLTAPHPSGTV